MEKNNPVFSDRVHELSWGTHMCSIYRSQEEQLAVAAPYLSFGLAHNERCVYIADVSGQESICRLLQSAGIDTERRKREGQLVLLTKEETYLKDGFFSPLGMLDLTQEAHYDALRLGYSGLRGSGELSWSAQDYQGAGTVIDYERELNFFFLHNRFIALCQYNEEKVPESILFGVLRTHPKAVIYGSLYDNPLYVPPDILKQQARPEYQA